MSTSGKQIQWPEMLQQKFSSRHRELDNYHGLILLMIIKFSSMENQSKRRKEIKKTKFYFIDNYPGYLYAHVERRIFEIVPMI